MKKPVIGIISTPKLFMDNDPFNDQYCIVNSYVRKLANINQVFIDNL